MQRKTKGDLEMPSLLIFKANTIEMSVYDPRIMVQFRESP